MYPQKVNLSLATEPAGLTTAQWYEWDLTAFLQSELAAGRSVVTLVLKNVQQTSATPSFGSDEGLSNQPELLVST